MTRDKLYIIKLIYIKFEIIIISIFINAKFILVISLLNKK